MIDFSKITKTVDGIDCCYLGQRISDGQVLHRFAVFNNASELFSYYNERGERINFFGNDGWAVCKGGLQIIAPPKIVEVTRWVGLYGGNVDSHGNRNGDGFYVCTYQDEPKKLPDMLVKQQHTFRFEVPND